MGVLRLLLALTVLNWHYPVTPYYYNFIFSRAAVFVFMMISGFYIAMVLNEKYGASTSGILTFYGNRVLRLMPPYWVALVGCILFEPTAWFDRLSLWFQVNDVLLFPQGLWANLTLTPAASGGLHLAQMFTVALEIMFYALAPFILFRGTRVLAGLFGATAALNGALWILGVDPVAWQYEFFSVNADVFPHRSAGVSFLFGREGLAAIGAHRLRGASTPRSVRRAVAERAGGAVD